VGREREQTNQQAGFALFSLSLCAALLFGPLARDFPYLAAPFSGPAAPSRGARAPWIVRAQLPMRLAGAAAGLPRGGLGGGRKPKRAKVERLEGGKPSRALAPAARPSRATCAPSHPAPAADLPSALGLRLRPTPLPTGSSIGRGEAGVPLAFAARGQLSRIARARAARPDRRATRQRLAGRGGAGALAGPLLHARATPPRPRVWSPDPPPRRPETLARSLVLRARSLSLTATIITPRRADPPAPPPRSPRTKKNHHQQTNPQTPTEPPSGAASRLEDPLPTGAS